MSLVDSFKCPDLKSLVDLDLRPTALRQKEYRPEGEFHHLLVSFKMQ